MYLDLNRNLPSVLILFSIFTIVSTLSSWNLKSALADDLPRDDNNTFSYLVYEHFNGTYNSDLSPDQKLFGYLDSKSGISHISFYHDPGYNNIPCNFVAITLFDPIYHDLKVGGIYFNLGEFNQSTQYSQSLKPDLSNMPLLLYNMKTLRSWSANQSSVAVQIYNKGISRQQENCTASYDIFLARPEGSTDPSKTILSYRLKSSDQPLSICQFAFSVQKAEYYSMEARIAWYCLFVSLLLIVEMFLNYRLIAQVQHEAIPAQKISFAAVCICTAQDLYFTLMFVTHLMNEGVKAQLIYFCLIFYQKYYLYYVVPIILFSIQTTFINLRLLVLMWRHRYLGNISRRKLLTFYAFFYIGMLGYITIMFLFPNELALLALQSTFFLAQIVRNARMANNPGFYPLYVFGYLSLRRYTLPLYERACPYNLFTYHPSIAFGVVWTLLFVLQIVFLYLQYLKGPRFFIPKRFIPGYYEYEQKMNFSNVSSVDDIPDCPICLHPIHLNPDVSSSSSVNDSMSDKLLQLKNVKVMKAPCNHIYHKSCLLVWIDVKLECPVCRARLPPLFM